MTMLFVRIPLAYFLELIVAGILMLTLTACGTTRSGAIGNYDDAVNRQFWSADWSPDDNLIAVAGVDSTLRLFHSRNLKLYRSYPIPSWIHIVRWNPDGRTIAIATSTDYVQILDTESGEILKLNNNIGPFHDGNGSRGIGWNHTGELLAVAGLDGVVKVWNTRGELISYLDKYPPGTSFTSFLALDWHPQKDIFVAASFEILLLDHTCQVLQVMEHANPEAIILCAAWHPSGDFFVLGDYGYQREGKDVPSLLHFWSSQGALIRSIPGSKREIRNLDWSRDGSRLAMASDVLRIWTADGRLLNTGPEDGTNYLWGVSWNADASRIVTASRYQSVCLWDDSAGLIKRVEIK